MKAITAARKERARAVKKGMTDEKREEIKVAFDVFDADGSGECRTSCCSVCVSVGGGVHGYDFGGLLPPLPQEASTSGSFVLL